MSSSIEEIIVRAQPAGEQEVWVAPVPIISGRGTPGRGTPGWAHLDEMALAESPGTLLRVLPP